MIKPPIEQTINLMNLGKSGNIFSDNLNVNKNIMETAAIEVKTEKRLLLRARLPKGIIEVKIFSKII